MYFQFRSMQNNIIGKLTRVTKIAIAAMTQLHVASFWFCFVNFSYRGRPGWHLPYEQTTRLVSGGKVESDQLPSS